MKKTAVTSRIKLSALSISLLLMSVAAWSATPVYFADPGRSDNSGDGRSWATAKQTLQAAIDATTTAHQVWAKAGTYSESITLKSGVALYGGFAGAEVQLDDRSTTSNLTIIDGAKARSGLPAYHVVVINSGTGQRLDGFTITGGQATGSTMSGYGGGLYCSTTYSNIIIANCTIAGNIATSGGGLYLSNCGVALTNCIIADNSASTGGGAYTTMATWSADGCVISGNTAAMLGGGLMIYGKCCTLTNCVLSGNIAGSNGGALNWQGWSNSSITNCTFSDNTAGFGGGIYMGSNGNYLTLQNSIFTRNAQYGIYEASTSCHPKLIKCLISGNPDGDYYDDNLHPVTGANNINLKVVDTTTTLGGTPGFIMDGAGALTGTWSTPAAFDHATSRTTLTTMTALTPGALARCLINPNVALQHQFLIQDNTTSTIVLWGDATIWTHQGDTWKLADYHLAAGSDALNRGALSGSPATDIDGEARPGADGMIDIGADEAPAAFLPGPDSTPPISQVKALPTMITSSTLSLPVTLTDDQSGIKEIRLYYRLNGGSWNLAPTTFTLAGNPLRINTDTLGGDGLYEFYSVAVDNACNIEPAPALADASTQVLSVFTSPRIYVDLTSTQLENGLSWANACHTISLALTLAARFHVPEVWVAAGCYAEGVSLPGNVSLYGGFSGNSGSRETALYQRNVILNRTVINPCAVSTKYQVSPVSIKSVSACRLDGFTLTGGLNASGLAIDHVDGSVVVANCAIRGNYFENGGGISVNYSTPIITSCTISNNIAAYSGIPTPGAVYGRGGGIYLLDSRPVINHCLVANNMSGNLGGGIMSEVQGSNASLGGTLDSCIISGNQAWVDGGGICENCKITTITNCIISANTAGRSGGGICYNWPSFPLTVRNSTFYCNAAPNGNDLYYGASNKLTLLNTIFVNHPGQLVDYRAYNSNIEFNHCLFFSSGSASLARYASPSKRMLNSSSPAVSGDLANIEGDPCFTLSAKGTWTDAPTVAYDDTLTTFCTRFYDVHAGFKPGALAGRMIRPDATLDNEFLIQDNTTTSVLIIGRIPAMGAIGKNWQVAGYHLGAGSAAAGRGALVGAPATDIDDQPRPGIDDLIDIGADEASPVVIPARDTGAPASQITGAPTQAFATTFLVPFTAADTLSGVRDVQLFFRRNGGTWMRYPTPNAVFRTTDSPIAFDTTLTGGDGYYELYTVAVDNDGNTEATPATPAATVSVVTRPPGTRLYVNQNATGASRDGISWATACREVGDALNEAAVLGGVKEIWVARGRYMKQMTFPSNVAVYGGFSGRETRLEDRSTTTYISNLDGSICNSGWWETQPIAMVNVANCRLDGFQITNGGISCDKATSCTISNCTISKGNGVFGTDSKLSIVRCAISQNIHSNIYLKTSTAEIEECTVFNGNISGGYGIWGDPSGGGLNFEACNVTLRRCTVANNLGTGLFASNTPLTLDRCWIAGNTGGGIILYGNGSYVSYPASISNSILSGNTGAFGIALTVSGSYIANITNCTIADQTVNGWGGAILYASGGVNGLIQNTLFYNDRPSAIYEMYDPGWAPGKTLQNCIFYQNAQGDLVRGGNPAVFGASAINQQMPGAEGNISGDPKFTAGTSGGKWTKIGAYDANRGVTPFYDANAKLTPGSLAGKIIAINTSHTLHLLAMDNTTTAVLIAADLNQYGMAASAYVGQTWNVMDYRVGTGSAALDAGVGNAQTLDYDGNPRPFTPGDATNAKIDIGAFEFQGTSPTPATHALTLSASNGTILADPKLTAYPHGSSVLLTPNPLPGYHFTGWSGSVTTASVNANPLLLTMDADKAVTALFAADRDVVININVTPGTAPWTLQYGKNSSLTGVGSIVLSGQFPSPLRVTWGALANYDLPSPGALNLSLTPLGGVANFSGRYIPRLGSVNLNAWPPSASWTLTDGLGGVRRGSGSARLDGVLSGARSLSVLAPAGFRSPMPNPIPFTVTQGQEAAVSAVLLPDTGEADMTYSRILRYLLGLTSDATGLDLNGDGKVTATDLIQTVKSTPFRSSLLRQEIQKMR